MEEKKKRGRGRPRKYDQPLDELYIFRVSPEIEKIIGSGGTPDVWRDRMILLASDPDLLAYVDQKLQEVQNETKS